MAVFDLENIIGKLALEKAGEKFLKEDTPMKDLTNLTPCFLKNVAK